jgi:hypothetical protein
MRFNPKKAWEDINKLAAGEGAMKSKKTVCFRMKNGKLATTDNENMEVTAAHFHTVYNNQKDITPNVLDKLSNRNIVENVDAIPTSAEFNKNLDNLANDQSIGSRHFHAPLQQIS